MDLAYLQKLPQEEFPLRLNRLFEKIKATPTLFALTETEKRGNNTYYLIRPNYQFLESTGFCETKSTV
ncbi:Xaa-Pro aminopeptidase, partial [Glaesserella parasuis]|nr:Xaa-Pro aminopeptidase [Glaesserella parasuis]